MLPVTLELQNFMTYRKLPALDFSAVHVLLLTGDNGAGKSTLFDAITWALWGKARGKRDDELINQHAYAEGQQEMRVTLTFKVSRGVAKTNLYRVMRTRKLARRSGKAKAPTSSGTLDFWVWDETSQSWRSISEAKQYTTQDFIQRELGLGYETFVNSAFLKQGRADEFTTKAPAERKAILAEILDLAIWAEYETRTKEQIEQLNKEKQSLQQKMQGDLAEIEQLPNYRIGLRERQRESELAKTTLDKARSEEAQVKLIQQQVDLLQKQMAATTERLTQAEKQLQAIQQQQQENQDAQTHLHTLLQDRPEIETNYATLTTLHAENEGFNKKLMELRHLDEQKKQVEQPILQAHAKLEQTQANLQAQQTKLQQALQVLPDQTLENKLQQEIAEIGQQRGQTSQLQEQCQRWRTEQAEKEGENKGLWVEMDRIKKQIDALQQLGATCPTCGRELSEQTRQEQLAEWETQGKQLGDVFRANKAAVQHAQTELAQSQAALVSLEQGQQRFPSLQQQLAHCLAARSQAEQWRAELVALQQEQQGVAGQLQTQNYAQEYRAALLQIQAQLQDLGYDADAHRVLLQERLPQFQKFEQLYQELSQAKQALQQRQEKASWLQEQHNTWLAQVQQEKTAYRLLQTDQETQQNALRQAQEAMPNMQECMLNHQKAQRREVEMEQRVEAILQLQTMHQRYMEQIHQYSLKLDQWDMLKEAFGKNGVPAMIIESVLPELENHANQLLANMTSGRMHVRFETQRLTQSGSTSETLDIRIHDEVGERSYDMFSGGEAFRINFAIRIALSMVLAQRAGTRLETLFIDEGFGTQDAQGRERLVEAIQAIEDRFSCIVIVTHIEELKELFNTRFHVSKTNEGSQIDVV